MHFCNRYQTAGARCLRVDAVVALHVASCVQRMHHVRSSAGFLEIRGQKPQNMAVFSCFGFSNDRHQRNCVVQSPRTRGPPSRLSSQSCVLDSADLLRIGNGGRRHSVGKVPTEPPRRVFRLCLSHHRAHLITAFDGRCPGTSTNCTDFALRPARFPSLFPRYGGFLVPSSQSCR